MNSTKIGLVLLTLATAGPLAGREITYLEDFALAADREAALQRLIPGTEDYYYFHCIHLQNTEQFEQADRMLKAWIKKHKRTPRVREILNRQALLTYASSPRESLEHIRQQLGIRFNHQRERLDQKPDLPTSLDPDVVSRSALLQRALKRHKDLKGFEDAALEWLMDEELDHVRLRHLLQRLQRPDHPGLVSLIIQDLRHKPLPKFGSYAIHKQLLPSQLEECLQREASLLNQLSFVRAYISKLLPNDDVHWQDDDTEYGAYLDRLSEFVERLGPVHNSLKAHVLYRRLELDLHQGRYDKQKFMRYLRLPRQAGYVNTDYLRRREHRRHIANLQQDYSDITQLAPVKDDEPLVRAYLQHFFLQEPTYREYLPFVNDRYVKELFAETKIVNGLGDADQWHALLSPEQYQRLRDRVDLDFAPTNSRFFGPDDPVSLDVYVKNVETLIVKVFEVNTANYYRQFAREVNTDIDLDGLVTNNETTYSYTEPPLRRVKRHFDFPSLDERGVYVIDFIGSGKNSRVVVRKGRLYHLARTTAAGHEFTILNESNRLVKKPTVWVGGQEFVASDDGTVVVPFTNEPQERPIVLSSGGFSSLARFRHQSESYSLQAGIYIDRESLLSQRKSTVAVRSSLRLNGFPVALSLLEQVTLTIESTDRDGVSSTQTVKGFELFSDREATHEFQTPSRLSQLNVTVSGKVQNLSQNTRQDVSAAETFSLNEIDKTEKIEDLHFAGSAGQFHVSALGKTGEPKADRPIQFSLKHRDFTDPVRVVLKTDKGGRVQLGSLASIETVTASGPEGTSHTWQVPRDRRTQHSSIHARVGDVIDVPYVGPSVENPRNAVSLLELREGTFVGDRFSALTWADGMIRIRGLQPGDYDLWLKHSGDRIRIRVASARREGSYLLGTSRQLEARGHLPLHIAPIKPDPESVVVRLLNASPETRVHVFTTRYLPAYSAFDLLGRMQEPAPWRWKRRRFTSLYAEGRDIGDELRYILDRQRAQKFPGNMLRRPSLLLNPWAIRTTETGAQSAADGESFDAQPDAAAAADVASRMSRSTAQPSASDFSNLDFLKDVSSLHFNLRPNSDGQITLRREDLGPHQTLHIVACDGNTTVYRTISLPEADKNPLDLRLARSLDLSTKFTQQKRTSFVDAGEPFEILDIGSSRFEVYDSLSRVFRLFTTLSNDQQLSEFGFILNWPNLDANEKQAKYSKYACHELNFFLRRKDPEFFERVVVPYLRNKSHKTFMDQWLLDVDLREYQEPWDFGQLNIAERILLGQRLASERPHTRRHVQELFHLIPPNIDRFHALFDTAILGRSLDVWPGAMGGMAGGIAAPANAARRELSFQSLAEQAPALQNSVNESLGLAADVEELDEQRRRGYYANSKSMSRDRLKRDVSRRGRIRQLFRKLDNTQEWVENNYYRLPIQQQNADLVQVNSFWNDFAAHDPSRPFFSANFPEATRNFTEMMLALSVLDLPFEAHEHSTELQGGRLTFTPGSPVFIFHEQIRPAKQIAEQSPILVSQNFYRQDDRYEHVNNERRDKFVTDEFLVHTVYGCQVVVTNPSSSRQKLDLLLQVPVGAVPVMNGRYTRSVHVDLEPFNTQTVDYHFYFPLAGQFDHYPVHVAKDEQLLTSASPARLNVVKVPSRVDRQSWDYVFAVRIQRRSAELSTTKQHPSTQSRQNRVPRCRRVVFLNPPKIAGTTTCLQRHALVLFDSLWST